MPRRMRLLVLFIAVGGCAGTQAKPKVVLLEGKEPPADCQPLGEVVGSHADHNPSAEDALENARWKASKLGATHLLKDGPRTGRSGAHTETFTGQAYRCPAGR